MRILSPGLGRAIRLSLTGNSEQQHHVPRAAHRTTQTTFEAREWERFAPRPHQCVHVQLGSVATLRVPVHAVLLAEAQRAVTRHPYEKASPRVSTGMRTQCELRVFRSR